MSPRRIVVIGGGEHARVVMDAVRSGPDELLGFVDPEPCERACAMGLRRLGDDEALREHPGAWGVLGLGAIERRERRAGAVRHLGDRVAGWATVVHRTAWISPSATLGEGTVILAGAIVQSGARIGAHCVVNDGAVVEHDVILDDFVQVGPRAAIGGGTTVGPDVYVGLGAAVRDHLTIGAGALIGMGAVVVRDVPPGARVLGVPAR